MHDDLQPVIDRALEWGVLDALVIPTTSIVTGEWVRLKCQFGCPNYGNRLDCPPNGLTVDFTRRLLADYNRAIVLKLARLPRYQQQGSGLVHRLERELFLAQYYRAFAIGAGSCGYCANECIRQPGRCPQQHRIRPAAESLGIDWFGTLRNLGWEIKVFEARSDSAGLPPSYSLVLVD